MQFKTVKTVLDSQGIARLPRHNSCRLSIQMKTDMNHSDFQDNRAPKIIVEKVNTLEKPGASSASDLLRREDTL